MITLTIDNSYSRISRLPVNHETELREILSYTTGSYFSGFGVRKTSLLSKRGDFASGLLARVVRYLNTHHIMYTTVDKRRFPLATWTEYGGPAYEWQNEALLAIRVNGRGTVSAPTGTGKSKIIDMVASCTGLRTLVIVPTLEIRSQLINTLPGDVVVENIDNPKLKSMTDFDLLILDECHHAAAKTYQKLNKTAWAGIPYRVCLTATPFRNNPEETLLYESIAGRLIYKLDYKRAIKENYIVPVEAYYIEVPKRKTEAFTYQEVYKELVVENELRNALIVSLILKLNAQNISTLCLVREVQHGKALAEMTLKPFVSGEDEDRNNIRRFSNGTINTLIGTTGIMGEGVDSRACEFVIIAGAGKAKSQFIQQIGRAVRKFPDKESAKIIIIKDKSHRFLSRHFKEQCAILKEEYGIEPVKLEI